MPRFRRLLMLWISFVSLSILMWVLSSTTVLAATNFDLATTTNYNLRFDGAVASDALGMGGVVMVDLNNNGKKDLIIVATGTDNNSRDAAGSVYVIYDSLLDDYTGTANAIDLNTSTNYNLRYDAAAAGDFGGVGNYYWMVKTADLDNDGKQDIMVGAQAADNNSRADSGSVYVIYNTLIDDYTGTGNNIDLNTATNYNLRYDGATASDFLGYEGATTITDLDNDGKQDILIGARWTDYNSRSGSGSLYVIYNTLIDDYSSTGNNIDLATSTNYNLRYDGAVSGNILGASTVRLADLDNDGKQDITHLYHQDK